MLLNRTRFVKMRHLTPWDQGRAEEVVGGELEEFKGI
jgi:hypothetical protein